MRSSTAVRRLYTHVPALCRSPLSTSAAAASAAIQRDRYLFDLTGYLVLRGVLSAKQVTELNEAVEANNSEFAERTGSLRNSKHAAFHGDGTSGRKDSGSMLTWPAPYCNVFRQLLAHPRLVPILNMLLGEGYRLDHLPLLIRQRHGAEGFDFHGGAIGPTGAYNSEIAYDVKPGPGGQPKISCQLINVSFALTQTQAGEGGFVILPGSHKASFPMPDSVASLDSGSEFVVCPCLDPGDVILFSEATAHGALPWTGAKERRTLFYRFGPGTSAYGRGYASIFDENLLSQLSPEQAAVLQPPFHSRLDRTALRVSTKEGGHSVVEAYRPEPRSDEKKRFDEVVFGHEYF